MKKTQVKPRVVKTKTARKPVKKKPAVVSRSFSSSLFTQPSKKVIILFVALFAVIGAALVIRSRANPLFSTNPHDVVLQYVLPHINEPVTDTNLGDTTSQPFTLYGNGLLICGQQEDNQFTAPQLFEDGIDHMTGKTPTATNLSKDDMAALIQKVRDTGFEGLKPEYFTQPVAAEQHTIRLVLKGSEQDVMYYNDVAPPDAYVKTLQVLKDACSKVTDPYVSDAVVLRARANVDTEGQPVNPADTLDQNVAPVVKNALGKSQEAKQKNDAKRAAQQQIDDSDEYAEVVNGQAAKDLQVASNGKSRKFVSQAGVNYEVGVDPQLPDVNNPFDVDYSKIRPAAVDYSTEDVSLLQRLHIEGKASATVLPKIEKFRIVLLLPSSGGSTTKQDAAYTKGSGSYKWYCAAVGRCYQSGGVSVIRGSQTQAYYNACHLSSGCTSNQLLNILYNVSAKDSGTIYRSDIITLVVPGWKTNTLSVTNKACGWGSVGGNISTVDLYQPDSGSSGIHCQLTKAFAHEFAHNLTLNHNGSCTYKGLMDGPPGCNYSNDCEIGNSYGPKCILYSAQLTKLRADYAHFPISSAVISGKVYNKATGVGMANIAITTCMSDKPTVYTDASGNWSLRVTIGTAFCGRIASTIPATLTGPVLNNNPEHAASHTYEYQSAGKSLYHSSTIATTNPYYTWDRKVDTGYDFAYTPTPAQ